MASMAAIPEDLYEAASLDGSSQIHTFFTVTLPLIWNNIRTTLTFYIISTINLSFLLCYEIINRWTKWKNRGCIELHVQTGLWRRCIWIWYGNRCSSIYFLICSCSSCKQDYRSRSLRILERRAKRNEKIKWLR